MADILFVCVSRDLARADALAEVFEAAGFSIGDLRRSDAELGLAGAGLLVWSQAASESASFCEAASRVVGAGRAVVASFDEAPAPASFEEAAVFDLSRWSGDPDDPLLDPLFGAVDRMAAECRAQAEHWLGAREPEPAPAKEAAADVADERAAAKMQRAAAPSRTQGKPSVRSKEPGRRRLSGAGPVVVPLIASAALAAAVYAGAIANSKDGSVARVAIPPAEVVQLVSRKPPGTAIPELAPSQQTAPREAPARKHASPAARATPAPREAPSVVRFDMDALSAPDRPQLLALASEALEVEIEPAVFRRRAFNTRGEPLSSRSPSRPPPLQNIQTGGSAVSFGPPLP